jgi:hypothetical protein
MTGAAAVLVCALELLGRDAADLPPIKLLALPPIGVSTNADGFVRSGSPFIYIMTSAPSFRDANCRSRSTLLKLASVIMHEAWHVRHGPEERGAYETQLMTLLRLGATPDSQVYRGVLRSMRSVLREQERKAAIARHAGGTAVATIAAVVGRAP